MKSMIGARGGAVNLWWVRSAERSAAIWGAAHATRGARCPRARVRLDGWEIGPGITEPTRTSHLTITRRIARNGALSRLAPRRPARRMRRPPAPRSPLADRARRRIGQLSSVWLRSLQVATGEWAYSRLAKTDREYAAPPF